MARKEKKPPSKRLKTERVGSVSLVLSTRSPYWWMYWNERPDGADLQSSKRPPRIERWVSTRETDLALARIVAAKKNEQLFTRKQYPELELSPEVPFPLQPLIEDFVAYLAELGRTHDHRKNIEGRLGLLASWMARLGLLNVQDITPGLLKQFQRHLRDEREVSPATANHYITAVHNFWGFAAFKRGVVKGNNPAATGRQAVLDKLPCRAVPPPTIYPDQVNAIMEKALAHDDRQLANLIVFVCEGGFRFQELQFLQVGDIRMDRREILLDIKKPDLNRVRMELRKRCLTAEGYWVPKTRASRRPVHITDRLAKVIGAMGLGDASDWVFLNSAGRQIAQNKTLDRLKAYALEASVLVVPRRGTEDKTSAIRWHWLRHYHRTRAHVSKIRREVSKVAMGHAADGIHDHYRGLDLDAFHDEYAKFDSGIDYRLLDSK
jgi:site-specific recombinase XerD